MNLRNVIQNPKPGFDRCLTLVFVLVATTLASATGLVAQQSMRTESRHYLYDYGIPPGEIAFRKTLARQSMVGYFQPVRLKGPDGLKIEVFSEGSFKSPAGESNVAGMLVGHIYRLKITNIPHYPGKELYPSVEIIGRLFPPAGKELRFPIPVTLGLEDLEPAMSGALVTRVIYLENPRTAIAEQRTPDDQPFFDVGTNQDPIRIAEQLGRPMVIVRIGSRIPDTDELNAFGFGTPPLTWYDVSQGVPVSEPEPSVPGPAEHNNEQTGVQRSSSVRQVGFEETKQETVNSTGERSQPMDSIDQDSIDQTPQQWSIGDDDAGPQTAITQTGLVRREATQPATAQVAVPGGNVDGVCVEAPAGIIFAQAQPMFRLPPWPDELLLDGGDRDLNALVKDLGDRWEVRGLDSEDTIAHFDTLDGRRIVDTSNRVAIYAPRFSAIRKIDHLGHTQYTNLLGRTQEGVAASSSKRTDFSSSTLQNIQPTRHKKLTPVVAVENRTRGVRIENGIQMKIFEGNFKTYENLRLIKTGFLDNREKGRLAIAIDRAISWNSEVSAQSTTRNMKVTVVADVKQAHQTIHVKTELNRPQIRLVKIASVDSALPGDVVDFTIRFDNVGDQPIGNVTILDNLTGRLDYIEGSAECSLPGEFITEPNKSGSHILRWEITDPLKATKGGVIRFQCRVR